MNTLFWPLQNITIIIYDEVIENDLSLIYSFFEYSMGNL